MYKRLELQGDATTLLALSLRRLAESAASQREIDAAFSELHRAMRPAINAILRATPPRGSVHRDDLEQVITIAIYRSALTYDPTGCPYHQWAYRHATSEALELLRRHSNVVSPSHWGWKGRAQAFAGVRPESRTEGLPDGPDADESIHRLMERRSQVQQSPEEIVTQMQCTDQLRQAVESLPEPMRRIVRAAHGVGRPMQSVRDFVRESGWSRTRAEHTLRQGMAMLTKRLNPRGT